MIDNDPIRPRAINPDRFPEIVHVLVVTALFEERKPVRDVIPDVFMKALDALNAQSEEHVSYELKPLPLSKWDLANNLERWSLSKIKNGVQDPHPLYIGVATLPDMGNAYAALHTSHHIRYNNPGLILLVGICGSADPEKLAVGDVLVSASSQWVNVQKLTDGTVADQAKYKITNKSFASLPPMWLGLARNHFDQAGENLPSNWDDPRYPTIPKKPAGVTTRQKVVIGSIVATNHVVDHTAIRDYHKDKSRALGIEMESGGMYASIALHESSIALLVKNRSDPKPPPIIGMVFKGVSDLCAMKRDDNWRAVAGYNAAFAAFSFLFSNLKSIEDEIRLPAEA